MLEQFCWNKDFFQWNLKQVSKPGGQTIWTAFDEVSRRLDTIESKFHFQNCCLVFKTCVSKLFNWFCKIFTSSWTTTWYTLLTFQMTCLKGPWVTLAQGLGLIFLATDLRILLMKSLLLAGCFGLHKKCHLLSWLLCW